MPVYYGVHRSDDYLAHYGIIGMKWGVRRAIRRGNDRALRRQYRKAQKKLKQLNRESNWFIHDLKGRAWGKLADSKSSLGKTASLLTAARIRMHYHNAMASDVGDLYKDKRRDKFKDAMNDAFRGTKYDQANIARMNNLKRAQRSKKWKNLRRKLHLPSA